MKLIIAGSRILSPSTCDIDFYVTRIQDIRGKRVTEIVSGGAKGVDLAGEAYAEWAGNIPLKQFLPDWTKGRGAGFIRNNQMAEYGDALLAFWDRSSHGTQHMIGAMKERNKPYWVVLYKFSNE